MGKIKYLSLIFVSIFTICCSVKKTKQVQYNLQSDNITGKYFKDNSPHKSPNVEEIILLDNNKVIYFLSYELYGTHSFNGSWSIVNDSLNLFFDIPPEKISGSVNVLYEEEKQKNIQLIFEEKDGNKLEGISIFINEEEYFLYKDGLKIQPIFIDEIKIDYYGEIYIKKINKFVDTNLKIIITPDEWRIALYDFLKTKWLVKEDELILIENDSIIKNYILKKEKVLK